MPTASDYTIEVRNRDYLRVGQLAPEYMSLKFTEVYNGIGAWEVTLPVGHPYVDTLRAKGAGLIITDRLANRVYSGRTRSARLAQSATDPEGSWVISGAHDNVVAAASLVYGDPANDAEHQTASNWGLSAAGETVMKAAVDLNIGSSAIASRKYSWLTIAANQLRGNTVSCSSRFDLMSDLLTSLGTSAGLGWRFTQLGNGVDFDVYVPADKTGAVRLDIRNGGVDSNELGATAPAASEVLVMGQGDGADRTILRITTPGSMDEATNWGLRWETTKDQRNTDDPAELTQAGLESLATDGETINSLKVTPSDAPGQRLGIDWYIGDQITVVVLGQETTALVTQVATSISSAGVIQQATIGDPTSFNYDAKIGAKLATVEKRVGQVEKQIGVGTGWDDVGGKPVGAFADTGDIKMTGRSTAQAGWLMCDGRAVSRTTYPDLFAAIGTAYGAGDGSTTFNLPAFSGRAPVGLDTTQTEFSALGQQVGEKTHTLTVAEMPSHTHFGGTDGSATNASGWNGVDGALRSAAGSYRLNNQAMTSTGGGAPHNNLPPELVVNFIIKT